MEAYDFIIAGGGSAGCVLAARLSADPDCRVLLLEAGPDYAATDLPGELASGWGPAFTHDWGYRAEFGPGGRTDSAPRAKVVGGCSATNATCALRGAAADYDRWAAAGNRGWSFDEVLPHFRELEHDLDFANEWHGNAGPVPIRRFTRDELTPWQAAAFDAALADGHALVADLNRPAAVGVGAMPTNTVDGRRMSAAITHLDPARGRDNLEIRPGAVVDRVIVKDARATGVRLADSGEEISAGTVVLAAGSYGSPAILLRSGLGPAADLASLGIEVVVDLPGVGQNLQDHPAVMCAVPVRPVEPQPRYQVIVTWRSRLAATDEPFDMQLLPGVSLTTSPDSPTGGLAYVAAALMRPRSRGRLRLRSADPNDPPEVDLGYFTHADDLARMVDGVHAARGLLDGGPLRALATGSPVRPAPGADGDGDLAGYVRDTVGTYHHPVGTCAMGVDPAAGAVVAPTAMVHGLEALYVADASVMPEIPAANTNLPTMMIAERVAAWLTSGQGNASPSRFLR